MNSSERPNESDPSYTGGYGGSDDQSALDLLDRTIASLPIGDPVRKALLNLRAQIADQEDTINEARQTIEKMEEVIKKVTSPANRIGTFLGTPNRETAQIVVGGSDYYCNVDPRININKLKKGTRVLVNEAYVIVGDLGYDISGPVAKVTEVIGDDRLRVGQDNGMQSLVLQRANSIAKETLKAGDEVRVDPNYRMALELMRRPKSEEHYLDEVPELPWEKVGGQQEALQAIREAIELPLVHAELFAKFNHTTPKGFLLYGPPGCGKTLIGKATAYNLTAKLEEKTGEKMKEYFMHIKGPEILNMWVGESERMVREIFATARGKTQGRLPAVPVHRRGREYPRHAARLAIFEHSLDARADVLHGNGRHRFAQRRGHHPRVQPRGPHRPRNHPPRAHRSQDQGQPADKGRRARNLQDLPVRGPALRSGAHQGSGQRSRRDRQARGRA